MAIKLNLSILVIFLLSAFSTNSMERTLTGYTTKECQTQSKISVHCGKTPSSTFDENNRMWVIFELNNFIYVNYSDDLGRSYSRPVAINSSPEEIYTNGENRPKIIIGLHGELFTSWTKKTSGKYTGDIRFSRSLDGGKTFSNIITINDDGLVTGHRFDSLTMAKDGTLYLSWIDKRDLKTKKFDGLKRQKSTASIYYSYSKDAGTSFSKNQRLAESSCVCCRIAMTPITDHQVALLWRHVFDGGIRDHAYAVVKESKTVVPMQRATFDDWKIDACPHHGPALLQDQNDVMHQVWFTASESYQGIFYARQSANSNQWTNQINVSNQPSASHPYILENDRQLMVVWKVFDGEKTKIMLQSSNDYGISWGHKKEISSTRGDSDHPFLLKQNRESWLSWKTNDEGLRMIKLMFN